MANWCRKEGIEEKKNEFINNVDQLCATLSTFPSFLLSFSALVIKSAGCVCRRTMKTLHVFFYGKISEKRKVKPLKRSSVCLLGERKE